MPIMGQISKRCMVCLMQQPHVSGSFEYPHFNMCNIDHTYIHIYNIDHHAILFCSLPHSASRVGCHDGQSGPRKEERGKARRVPVNASCGRTVKWGSKW